MNRSTFCNIHKYIDNIRTDNFSSIIAVAPESQPPAAAAAATTGALPKPAVTPPVLPLVPQPPPTTASTVSPSFANFNNQFGAATSAATRHSDFFDAFHDNFNKNDHSASISSLHTATSNGPAGTNMLDNAFGGSIASIASSTSNPNNNTNGNSNACDPFGVPRRSSTTAASNNNSDRPKAPDGAAFATDFNNDFFGGNGFEDEFASSNSSNIHNHVTAGSAKVPNASANLATSLSSSASTLTGASNNANNANKSSSNSSSSDFAKFDGFRDSAYGSTAPTNGNGFDPFADDDFGAAAPSAAVTNDQWGSFPSAGGKKVPNKEGAAEALKNPRYAADYSQGEGSFDKDLQEALKRSMVDQ